jgi:hypothetical protein
MTGEDSELKASFTPLYLPKTISLDLSIPFQRAQATMLLRQAAEHPGFSLLSLKYYKDINSSSCDEIHLVRQCLDLENVSIKGKKDTERKTKKTRRVCLFLYCSNADTSGFYLFLVC